ncbi:MAG: LacI family DNA-binding transcriptional regulator, partial [Methylobacteriaceae bacterium]|nr:LacI family DNA-binding transcriptional regulator [Methylobacteriaceae bacterium]
TGALRRRGFIEAMEEVGLDTGAVAVAGAYSRDAGEAAAASLLAAHPTLTAIAASNDLLALGAYRTIQASGRRCPEHLSVTGHNDMPLVDMVEPPLTTVRIGHVAMGERAARLLLQEVGGVRAAARLELLPAELVVRGSTAPVEAHAVDHEPRRASAVPRPRTATTGRR